MNLRKNEIKKNTKKAFKEAGAFCCLGQYVSGVRHLLLTDVYSDNIAVGF